VSTVYYTLAAKEDILVMAAGVVMLPHFRVMAVTYTTFVLMKHTLTTGSMAFNLTDHSSGS
jgi:hypothetical protein